MFCVSSAIVYSLRKAARPIGACAAALWLGGCAISTQLGPIFGSSDETAATGSITPPDKRFSSNMTDGDWAKARTALEAALSTANAGKAAAWDNPQTGLKGTVAPVAEAYAAEAQTCHAFVASLVEGPDTHWYQGRACRDPSSDWTVVDSSAWTPPSAS